MSPYRIEPFKRLQEGLLFCLTPETPFRYAEVRRSGQSPAPPLGAHSVAVCQMGSRPSQITFATSICLNVFLLWMASWRFEGPLVSRKINWRKIFFLHSTLQVRSLLKENYQANLAAESRIRNRALLSDVNHMSPPDEDFACEYSHSCGSFYSDGIESIAIGQFRLFSKMHCLSSCSKTR